VHLGSLSKVVAPGLRVGYAVVPEWLAPAFGLAKQATDLTSSSFNQQLAVELLATPGWFDTHVARLRTLYDERARALLAALDPRLEVVEPDGGMFLWAHAPVDAQALADACMARDVAIVPGTEFALRPGYEQDVRLSFSMLPPDDLREAARRMTLALDDLMSR
jgi:2-aminoadipate transaminase